MLNVVPVTVEISEFSSSLLTLISIKRKITREYFSALYETDSSRSWDAVGCTQKWLFLPSPESGEHGIHCRNGLEFEIRNTCGQILAQLSIYYVLRCKTRACFSLLLVAFIKPTFWELHENVWFSVWQSFLWSCMDVRVGLWRKLSAEELMLLNCGIGEDSWESLGLPGEPTSPFWRRSALGFLWKDWC